MGSDPRGGPLVRRSTERILTTHVGSLIRPDRLPPLIRAKQTATLRRGRLSHLPCKRGGRGGAQAGGGGHRRAERRRVRQIDQLVAVRARAPERLRAPAAEEAASTARGADRARFPEFYAELDSASGPPATALASVGQAVCVGPIRYTGQAEVQRDIANFQAALARAGVAEDSSRWRPASVIPDRKNEYYASDEGTLEAIAEAMRVEYRAIVDAGLLLQLDDARAAVTYDRMVPPATFADYRRWLERQVEAINRATDGIPAERIRYHVCWGSWPGPHTTDVPLKGIVDLILRVRAGAYLIEAANPRHEHEWRVWKKAKLPEAVLVPGVISHATNVVEHPELVAERIVRFARLVGRENVIARHRLRFCAGAVSPPRPPSIMWAKLEALAEGARLATRELWN